MTCVNGCYPSYAAMARFVYAKACDAGTEATKLPGLAMDAGREMLSKGRQGIDDGITKLSKLVLDSSLASKDYLADQADFLATGLSQIDPKLLGVDITVVSTSIVASTALALSAVNDAKSGEKTKAALKGTASLTALGAGTYGVFALGYKTIALATAARQ